MNDIAVHWFGVVVTVPGVVCDSPFAGKILHSALNDKDFVFSSGKGGWANRFHLVTNMFKYSWNTFIDELRTYVLEHHHFPNKHTRLLSRVKYTRKKKNDGKQFDQTIF